MIGLVLLALLALSRPVCSESPEEPLDSLEDVDLETLERPVLVRSCDLELTPAPGPDCTSETDTENLDCDESSPEILTRDCKSSCEQLQDPTDVPEDLCLPDDPENPDECVETQQPGSCVAPEDATRISLDATDVNECESKCREVFSTSGEFHGCEWKRDESGSNVCTAIISSEEIRVNPADAATDVCIPLVVPWGGFSFCQARLYRRYFGFKYNGYKCIPKKGWPMIFSYCIGNCFSSSTLGFPASEPEDRDCKCCSPWQMYRTWTFFTCYTPDEGPALTLFYPYSFISRCNCNTCVGVRGISDIELNPPAFGEKHAQETSTSAPPSSTASPSTPPPYTGPSTAGGPP